MLCYFSKLTKNPQVSKIPTVFTKYCSIPSSDWFKIRISSRYIVILIPYLPEKETADFNNLDVDPWGRRKTKAKANFEGSSPPLELKKFLVVWMEIGLLSTRPSSQFFALRP
jgi:hypothetical protein